MILKSLRLKNFRKFQDSYIEFPDGVTGVVGLNGSGNQRSLKQLLGRCMVLLLQEHQQIKLNEMAQSIWILVELSLNLSSEMTTTE